MLNGLPYQSSPIIVCDSDCACLLAIIDTGTAVSHITLLRAGIVAGAGPSGCFIGVASRTKVDLLCSQNVPYSTTNFGCPPHQTIRSRTMIFRCSTISFARTTESSSARSASKAGSTATILTPLTGFQKASLWLSSMTEYTRGCWYFSIQVPGNFEVFRCSWNTAVSKHKWYDGGSAENIRESHYRY